MASRKILKAIKGARLGDAEAQLELGNCYLEGGEGLAANLLSAYRWLSAAADQGSDKAAWLIGEKVPANAVDSPLRARVYFEKAAQAGSAAAATVLAAWEFAGALGPVGGGPDGSAGGAAIRRLRGAAEKGFLPAQVELGRLATLGRAPVEDLAWLERAAERGDKEAVTVLAGHYYRAGRCDLWRLGQVPGQPEGADGRNAAEQQAARLALQWHEVAWPAPGSAVPAERAYERGCLQLRQHQRAAGPWLESAAEAGHGRAAYLLGLLYLGASYINGLGRDAVPRGRWFPRSYPRAAHWLERAAGGGVAEADLALFVLHGLRGISLRDSGRQETCLVRAAEAGHPQDQFLLAESIWRQAADGLDARLQALRWWQWAAGSGHCGARERLLRHSDGGSAELGAGQQAAVWALACHSLPFAARLELAFLFALRLHECLLLDLRDADAGDFLRVDVSASYGKARRRLVRIETTAQRDALERARRLLLADGRPVPEDAGGNYASRRRRFVSLCRKIGLNPASVDAAAERCFGSPDVVEKIQHIGA